MITPGIVGEIDTNVLSYISKILADIYIKTCVPLVQYDILSAFQNKFVSNGDFVNMRFSLLAKILYIRQLFESIVKIYKNALANDTNAQNEANSSVIVTNLITLLDSYLKKVNNIDLNSNQDELKNITTQVHSLSDTALLNANKIEIVKPRVYDNQLALRNIIFQVDQGTKLYDHKVTQFWIYITVLIAFTVIMGGCLFGGKAAYVFVLSGIVFLATLFVVLVNIVMNFASSKSK